MIRRYLIRLAMRTAAGPLKKLADSWLDEAARIRQITPATGRWDRSVRATSIGGCAQELNQLVERLTKGDTK